MKNSFKYLIALIICLFLNIIVYADEILTLDKPVIHCLSLVLHCIKNINFDFAVFNGCREMLKRLILHKEKGGFSI